MAEITSEHIQKRLEMLRLEGMKLLARKAEAEDARAGAENLVRELSIHIQQVAAKIDESEFYLRMLRAESITEEPGG